MGERSLQRSSLLRWEKGSHRNTLHLPNRRYQTTIPLPEHLSDYIVSKKPANNIRLGELISPQAATDEQIEKIANPNPITLLLPEQADEQMAAIANSIIGKPRSIDAAKLTVDSQGDILHIPRHIRFGNLSYIFEEYVGAGGFGLVARYRPLVPFANQSELVVSPKPESHPIAVKFIVLDQKTKEWSVQREVLALEDAHSIHSDAPALVGARSFITEPGVEVVCIASEFIHGKTFNYFIYEMSEIRKKGNQPELKQYLQLLHAFRACLLQLQEMLQKGWRHCDIKPSNILLDEEHPWQSRLVDLGIADKTHRKATTNLDMVKGTPEYFSGPLMNGIKALHDVYTLGLTMGEAIGLMQIPKEMPIDQIIKLIQKGTYVRCDELNEKTYNKKLKKLFPYRALQDTAWILYNMVQPHTPADQFRILFRGYEQILQQVEQAIRSLSSIDEAQKTLLALESYIHTRAQYMPNTPLLNFRKTLEQQLQQEDDTKLRTTLRAIKEFFSSEAHWQVTVSPENITPVIFSSYYAGVINQLGLIKNIPELRPKRKEMQEIEQSLSMAHMGALEGKLQEAFSQLKQVEQSIGT
ncbi:MAG TPA: hypothetical protein VJB65_03140, partial [Patescibacteria group bacterium]|nr:hypothetical protein [Patescibacteria group bacterium]